MQKVQHIRRTVAPNVVQVARDFQILARRGQTGLRLRNGHTVTVQVQDEAMAVLSSGAQEALCLRLTLNGVVRSTCGDGTCNGPFVLNNECRCILHGIATNTTRHTIAIIVRTVFRCRRIGELRCQQNCVQKMAVRVLLVAASKVGVNVRSVEVVVLVHLDLDDHTRGGLVQQHLWGGEDVVHRLDLGKVRHLREAGVGRANALHTEFLHHTHRVVEVPLRHDAGVRQLEEGRGGVTRAVVLHGGPGPVACLRTDEAEIVAEHVVHAHAHALFQLRRDAGEHHDRTNGSVVEDLQRFIERGTQRRRGTSHNGQQRLVLHAAATDIVQFAQRRLEPDAESVEEVRRVDGHNGAVDLFGVCGADAIVEEVEDLWVERLHRCRQHLLVDDISKDGLRKCLRLLVVLVLMLELRLRLWGRLLLVMLEVMLVLLMWHWGLLTVSSMLLRWHHGLLRWRHHWLWLEWELLRWCEGLGLRCHDLRLRIMRLRLMLVLVLIIVLMLVVTLMHHFLFG
eukprot:PhM_4_TR18857/c0_g1_i1/m.43451